MKKLLILLCISFFSCENSEKVIKNVKTAFPNSKIYKPAGQNLTFVIVDSTGVKLVHCRTQDDKIANIESLLQIE